MRPSERTPVGLCAFSMTAVALTLLAAGSSALAQERVPSPAVDNQMLDAFRARTLQEMGLTEDYNHYVKTDIKFPKQTGITSDEQKKRWIFVIAISRLQLDWIGYSFNTTSARTQTAAKTVLGRIFKTFSPGELDAVSRRWTPSATPNVNEGIDPRVADRVAADGESAARALLRDYSGPEKAAAYDSASMLQQADMLLEAGAAVTRARTWPTAYILSLTDTAEGYTARETFVKPFLGKDCPEYQTWPSMTDRQRGAATKAAILAAFDLSRHLAQGTISVEEWAAVAGGVKVFDNPKDRILLAGGRTLWDRYTRSAEPEQREIVVAATLKAQGWLWTLQGAL